jgi:dephospho-CoA kinase
VGLTGGIGSGKSTVAGMLRKLGAAIIDSDCISRELTAGGGGTMAQIRSEFGVSMVQPDGALNRQLMRELIYADPSARQRLEAIIHPLVMRVSIEQAQSHVQQGLRCLVFDIPLLVESGHWRRRLDRILVIDCRPDSQIQRVVSRSSLEVDAVKKIMASQASRQHRLRAADDIIFNDSLTLTELASEVSALAITFGLSSSQP